MKLIIQTLILILISLSAFADPISKQEADEWVNRLRAIRKWNADFDVQAYYENRVTVISEKLELAPKSTIYRRDLADAYHALGHFAEARHDFIASLYLQQKALNFYLSSGEKAKGSWADGVEHAYEHIFMAHYDQAVLLLRRGKTQAAVDWFTQAFRMLSEGPEVYRIRSHMKRIDSREYSFVKTQPEEIKSAVNENLRQLSLPPVSFLCKALF